MSEPFPAPDPRFALSQNGGGSQAQLRRWVYTLLITVTAAMCAGRQLNAQRLWQPGIDTWPGAEPQSSPTFGSNDRARWATVRALVDKGTYAIGRRTELPPFGELSTLPVQSLQLGRILGYFPVGGFLGPTPLPPPVYRDEGIVFEDGWTSIDKVLNPHTKEFLSTKPQLLPTVVAGEYWLLKRAFGWTFAEHRWELVRIILFTINWLPMVIYLVLLSRMVERWGTTDWGRLFVVAAGCFGTFLTSFITVFNNHTMAAFAILFAIYPILLKTPAKAGAMYWRFALSGFFTGWAVTNEFPAAAFGAGLFLMLVRRAPVATLLCFVPAALVPIAALVLTDYWASGEWIPVYAKFGTIWYNFAGAYWARPKGIDAGLDSPPEYAFHLLIGHHGIFSLSPVFLLSLAGIGHALARPSTTPRVQRALAVLTLALTVIVLVFYLQQTKNYTYGGWTAGPRWFFWLIPLWLLTMIPAADYLSRKRWLRGAGYLLLAFSVMSASYPTWNPWRHPWIYDWLTYVGVKKY